MPRSNTKEPALTSSQLRAWRAALQLTQIEAAYLLGISPRQYSNLENGFNRITKPIKLACLLLSTIYESMGKTGGFSELFDAMNDLSSTHF